MAGIDTGLSAQHATCTGARRWLLGLIVRAEALEVPNGLCLSFQVPFWLSQGLN